MNLTEFRRQWREAERLHKKEVIRGVVTILLAAAAAVLLFQFVIGIAVVRGDSMLPGLRDGAVVLYLRPAAIHEGDIVVLHDEDEKSMVIKRVVGVAGDQVQVDRYGRCMRNGSELIEPYAQYAETPTGQEAQGTIETGKVFVMGDNRAQSVDSRVHGSVAEDEIVGKVITLFEVI